MRIRGLTLTSITKLAIQQIIYDDNDPPTIVRAARRVSPDQAAARGRTLLLIHSTISPSVVPGVNTRFTPAA